MSSLVKPPAEKIATPPPTNPKKKPFSSPNEMVTFIVGTGDKQETFQIHKQIACEHSEVWNRAFNSVFVEGQTQTYRIEDTVPEVFRLLTQWVYREEFDHVHSGELNAAHKDFDSIIQDCRYVYDNTAEGSVLRRFVIEHSCWGKTSSFRDKDLFSYPVEALGDIILALERQLPENFRAKKCTQMIGENYLVEEDSTTES
ncbi:uncharacterized protein EAE97_003023 [Botrytis byssoidea]|uniref:BTB domain-containing protein n=1 Tax=Botrytis byssoidea TaxID=139641 RepID=A0A9P5IVZ8_9HELO|nr:uncharacterized protein EAE97_003023 [Botrytis byssoidea]KAF7949514.1 hypothetical protein EAE97_003023 [Botrytis byssoidea]